MNKKDLFKSALPFLCAMLFIVVVVSAALASGWLNSNDAEAANAEGGGAVAETDSSESEETGETTSSTDGVVVYSQEAFLWELLTADGTSQLNASVKARCAGAAVTRYGMSDDDPYAWVVGFADILGYLPPEDFNPKADATAEDIVLILERYTSGWGTVDAFAVPETFTDSPQAVQEAAVRVVSRLGKDLPLEAGFVPSDTQVKELLKLLTKEK
ncbi:MAG: hypothetical protein LBQ02_02770 [Candidatus Nomurabacteria bacterium]|nr:hypothetical protein [Candidatus Nomurabacteria bacterium]